MWASCRPVDSAPQTAAPRTRTRRVRAPAHAAGRRGFTLLELLVVLAIIAVLSAMVGPAVWRSLDAAAQRGAAADLQAQLAALPLAAFAAGRPLRVDAQLLRGRMADLPDGCAVLVPVAFTYAPNGMTPGGTVQLACGGRVETFAVRPVTGEVLRADGTSR